MIIKLLNQNGIYFINIEKFELLSIMPNNKMFDVELTYSRNSEYHTIYCGHYATYKDAEKRLLEIAEKINVSQSAISLIN